MACNTMTPTTPNNPTPVASMHRAVQASASLPLDTKATVAVVIVNHNGGDKLLKTLLAIAEQPHRVEQVIVVDSASTDASPDRAAECFPQANVIKLQENVGPCVTRNTGVARCKAQFVLLLDSDVYVKPDTIQQMLDAQRETRAAVVCPRIILLPEGDQIQCEGATNHFLGTSGMRHGWMNVDEVEPKRAKVDGAISAALLVDRAFYEKAGGFDPVLYFYYEDLEFGLRVQMLGGQIVCEPNAVVLHDRGTGTAGLSFRGKGSYPRRRMFLQLRNRLMLVFIYYRLRTLLVLSPALLLYEGVSLGAAVAKRTGGAWFSAWAGVFALRGEISKRRKRIQRERVINDRDIYSGGPVPLAPGFVKGGAMAGVIGLLNMVFGLYWTIARRLIG